MNEGKCCYATRIIKIRPTVLLKGAVSERFTSVSFFRDIRGVIYLGGCDLNVLGLVEYRVFSISNFVILFSK